MKKAVLFFAFLPLILGGCFSSKSGKKNTSNITSNNQSNESSLTSQNIAISITSKTSSNSGQNPEITKNCGVFLGAGHKDTAKIFGYELICVDLDEFSSEDITILKQNNQKIFAYLSCGSLESYRSYYEEFKDITFADYENWPDEKWVDVSQVSWQNHIMSEATRLVSLGADGLFLDNFDVYDVVLDGEYTVEFLDGIYSGLQTMMENLATLNIELIMNSGSSFLSVLYLLQEDLLQSVTYYCQEEVYSKIVDYDNDVFGTQDSEEHEYYLDAIEMLKDGLKIILLEYTTDEALINEITSYCKANNYYYYISSHVDLTV